MHKKELGNSEKNILRNVGASNKQIETSCQKSNHRRKKHVENIHIGLLHENEKIIKNLLTYLGENKVGYHR